MMNKNYYHLLDLKSDAKPEQIKKAFRLFASKYHPDKHDGDKFFEEKFVEVKEAYDVLSNPILRKKYDEELIGDSKPKNNSSKPKENQSSNNNFSSKENTYQSAKPKATKKSYETNEEKDKREKSERTSINFLIGLGTLGITVFLFSSLGDYGNHVPIAMFFAFWTMRQAFVVLISFLAD